VSSAYNKVLEKSNTLGRSLM